MRLAELLLIAAPPSFDDLKYSKLKYFCCCVDEVVLSLLFVRCISANYLTVGTCDFFAVLAMI